jgi:hypothetical protein
MYFSVIRVTLASTGATFHSQTFIEPALDMRFTCQNKAVNIFRHSSTNSGNPAYMIFVHVQLQVHLVEGHSARTQADAYKCW